MNTNRLYSNCCGGGGLYLAMRDSRTLKIATKRLMEAPADARSIITACPSCEVSLSIAAADHGLDIEVLDIGELWWRASEKR
jgi:Fe-S oxidoreductase